MLCKRSVLAMWTFVDYMFELLKKIETKKSIYVCGLIDTNFVLVINLCYYNRIPLYY